MTTNYHAFTLCMRKKTDYLTHDNKRKEIFFEFSKFVVSTLCKECVDKFSFNEKQDNIILSTNLINPKIQENDICQQCRVNIK